MCWVTTAWPGSAQSAGKTCINYTWLSTEWLILLKKNVRYRKQITCQRLCCEMFCQGRVRDRPYTFSLASSLIPMQHLITVFRTVCSRKSQFCDAGPHPCDWEWLTLTEIRCSTKHTTVPYLVGLGQTVCAKVGVPKCWNARTLTLRMGVADR